MGCLTVVLSFFNFIFWLLGGAMIGLAVWALVDDDIYDYLVLTGEEYYWEVALYIIIAVGSLIFLVGVLGCVAACTSNKCITIVFGIFVIIAVLLGIGAITIVAISYANIDTLAYNMMDDVKYDYKCEEDDVLTQAWNRMQLEWGCCGSLSYEEYKGSTFDKCSDVAIKVPWTCCVLKSGVDPKYATIDDVRNYTLCQAQAIAMPGSDFLYKLGCYYWIEDVIDIAAPVTLGVLSLYIIVQIIALGMACCMMTKKNSTGTGGGKMI